MGAKVTKERLLALLPATQEELAAKLGVVQSNISHWLTRLRSEPRLVRVIDWRKSEHSGPPIAIYGAGSDPDVPCPFVPMSDTERSRRRRAALKAAKRKEEKPQRDPLTAAFFGDPSV